MGRLAPVLRMVAQRSAGHGRLFAAMTVGAVLAAGLMACVIIYSDAIRDLGLKYALDQQPDRATDLAIMSSSQEFTGKAFETRKATTDALIAQQGDIVSDVVHYARSATFYLTGPGAPLTDDENRPRAHFQSIDELMKHVHLVAGREPAPATLPPSGPPTVEVLAGKAAADQLGFGVGAEFDLHPHWQENAPPVRVVVAGLIEPNDPDEAYWFGKTDRFAVTTTAWPTYPFFSDEKTLTTVVGGYLPDLDGSFETYAFVDRGKIDSGNARRVEDGVRGLDSAVKTQLQYSYLQTTLADTIANYREQLFFTRLPLFALMLQVVGIALFYLVMVSTAVVDRQAGEIALMKSRGASTAQVVAVFALEGLGITIIGTVLGPLLAMVSISLLGLTPPFHELSNGDLLEVSVGPWAFAMAALGSAMAFAALLWPAYRASRHSVTHYKAHVSRPDQQSAFLKYYLDLVLIGVAAFLFYQLRQRGSLTTENVFGDLSADPLLLATPSLFMLMVALVFLRIFPLVLKVALWLSRGLKGPTVSLGLTRMARAPVQHSRLILLLILTTAVGMFAAGFRSTLERGYEDRASYLSGAEVRLEDVREPLNQTPAEFERTLAPVIDSRTVSPAVRLDSSYSPTRLSSVSVGLLGVDPVRFGKILNWRGDFASKSKDDLMKAITYQPQPPAVAPVEVPADAQWIGAWVRIDGNAAPYFLGIRLVDEEGGFWEYRLTGSQTNRLGRRGGQVVATGQWAFYAAALENPSVRPNGGGDRPVGAKLDSLFIQVPAPYPPGGEPVTAYLDDVEVTAENPGDWSNGFPNGTVIEGFDTQGRYDLVRGASLNGSPGAFSQSSGEQAHSGAGIRLAFTRGSDGSPVVGVRAAADPAPIPVLVSERFLDEQHKKVGDEFVLYTNRQYVDVKIAGSYKLFPTFDPKEDTELFVADIAAVRSRAARLPGLGGGAYANELWMGPGGPVVTMQGLQDQGFQVDRLFDREVILAQQRSDPLVAASWEGILFLSFAAVLLLSGLGFVIYSGLSARARSLEFAILRTMGLSGRQILGVVSFEQAFVILSGVLAGTLLGFPLSRLMIGYMGLTEHGEKPLPPLISSVSWQAVVTVYTLLGLVVVATVAALVALYSRVAVSRALRMGDL